MLRRLAALFRESPPPTKRMVDLALAIAELEARMDYLESELKSLRGRVTGAERRKKAAEDALQDTIGVPDISQHHPRAVVPTAHLAQRFKR